MCVSRLKKDPECGQAYNALVSVLSSDSIAAELAHSKVSPCLAQSNNRSGASSDGGEAGAAPSSSQALTALRKRCSQHDERSPIGNEECE